MCSIPGLVEYSQCFYCWYVVWSPGGVDGVPYTASKRWIQGSSPSSPDKAVSGFRRIGENPCQSQGFTRVFEVHLFDGVRFLTCTPIHIVRLTIRLLSGIEDAGLNDSQELSEQIANSRQYQASS